MRIFSLLPIVLFLPAAGCVQSAQPRPDPDARNYPSGQAAAAGVYFASELPSEDEAPPPNAFVGTMDELGAEFKRSVSSATDAPIRFWKYVNGDRASNAARKMEDGSSPDIRREGINQLLGYDFTKRPPYTVRYRQIAIHDADPTVRAIAIRASNRARDRNATGIWVSALHDTSDLVRLEAAKALVHIPDPEAVTPLLALLSNREEDRDVRIAAADALKHYRRLPVARALSGVLSERDFGVAWQARQSLRYLTGRDFHFDEAAWLAYFTGPQKPFG